MPHVFADLRLARVGERKGTQLERKRGPLIQRSDPFEYDGLGRRTSVTDPLGRVNQTAYDPANRQVTLTEPVPDDPGSGAPGVTQLTYDEVGNLISLLDASSNQTLFTFDFLNRLVTETDPLGRSRQYQYDAVGNLTRSVDRNLRRRDFQYDELDRVTGEAWFLGTSAIPIHSIGTAYDAAGRLAGVSEQEGTKLLAAVDRTPREPICRIGNLSEMRESSGEEASRRLRSLPRGRSSTR